MSNLNSETLLNLGFVDVAAWTVSDDALSYQLDGPHAESNQLLLEEQNALTPLFEMAK
jgi:hypothetical protein